MTKVARDSFLKNHGYDQTISVAQGNNTSSLLSESTVIPHNGVSTKRKIKNLTECSASNHIQNVEAEVVAKRTKIPTVTPTSSTDGDLEFTTESSADEEFDIQQAPSNDSTESLTNQFTRIWKPESQAYVNIAKEVNKIYEEFSVLYYDISGKNLAENTMNSSAVVKKIFSLIDDSSVEDLVSLGAGDLWRLTKIVNDIHADFKTVAAEMITRKLMVREDKLQCAFIRVLSENNKNKELAVIEKVLIYFNSKSKKVPDIFFDYGDVGEFLKNVDENPSLLKGLSKDERLFLISAIKHNIVKVKDSKKPDFSPNKILNSHGDKMEVRSFGVSSVFEFPRRGSISHKTTLFALIHKEINNFLGGGHVFLEEINNIVVMSVLNHDPYNSLIPKLKNILRNNANLSPGRLESISKSLDSIVEKFQPTENVGHQIDSPLAMKLHNSFARMCLERPSREMIKVARKIYDQFINTFPGSQKEILKAYLKKEKSTYPIFKKMSGINKLKSDLKSGENIALTIDFQHFYCEKLIGQWDPNSKEKGDHAADKRLDKKRFRKSEILNRLFKEQVEYTYQRDISNYRGDQVPLPKFDRLSEKAKGWIGVGSHTKGAVQFNSESKATRPSTVKRAVYGSHAIQSSRADTAHGCGTTGRANIHLWPMAYVNNKIHDPDLQFTPTDTANFLLMLAAVLTADGGHTLTEVLATANIAAGNAKKLLNIPNNEPPVKEYLNKKFPSIDYASRETLEKFDKNSYKLYKRCLAYSAGKKVSNFFSMVLDITKKMDTVPKDSDVVVWENFKCYDMIFSNLGADQTALNYMKNSWAELLRDIPSFAGFDEREFWVFK